VATWIFDATEVPIFVYTKFWINSRQVYFCCDEFRETYVTDSGNVQVLFHCSDGKLRQACYDSAVKIVLSDSSELFVRLLEDISQAVVKNLSYFFKDNWPLQDWPAKILSVNTALQERGLARGCPPRLRRRHLPATSKIGERRKSKIDI